MLQNIRIVLCHTTHPGNIGSTARAMKTMGLERLYLVSPKSFPDSTGKAFAMSAGAEDILEKAVITEELESAIGDCKLVIGTSARSRDVQWPLLSPRVCAEKVAIEAVNHEVAILFGRESSGLTNEELQRCHFHVKIPANPNYSSLNLAAAVQILAYEIYVMLMQEGTDVTDSSDMAYASAQEVENFYQHLDQVLHKIHFIETKQPNRIMQRLRRLYNRARLEKVEINILRGILTEMEKYSKK